ncbi:MAG: 1,4-dihydroxy-6-naphthoate synthase [Saprospiraceae bacterium]|nr:1,4-dihydroxy-6-naphthoate synthase [Saprospiraceae bacterium]
MSKKLTFAFSPCPNDTFMFEPIVNNKVDLKGLEFEIIMEDVEYLNKAALHQKFDITKLSFNAFTQLTDHYQLLHSGSALGRNCGPLLISKKKYELQDVENLKIVIPGKNTTAYLLLKYAFPNLQEADELLFSEIENKISDEIYDAGLIIHENRFTYAEKGLHKIIDLGEYWEKITGFPIPLGGIVIRKSISGQTKKTVDSIMYDSIAYAFAHPEDGLPFIRQHAQEMNDDVMKQHINLYVNDFSAKMNDDGKKAIAALFEFVAREKNEQAKSLTDLFVPE